MLADGVEDHVVGLAVLGEVLVRVVDHFVGTERSHQLDVLGVAHGGHAGAEALGELHAGGADGPRGSLDHGVLTLAEMGCLQAHSCENGSVGYPGGPLKPETGLLML